MDQRIRLFVCGDVMTGRGIDQVLPYPSQPQLFESYIHDARDYVELAEAAHGRIPRPVPYGYIWGDALEEFSQARPDGRVINLETSITTSDYHWPDKEVHYRMSPQNIGCLTAARIDCCALANNHVLDWGYEGLAQTLATLDEAGISHAGAGANATEAQLPAVLDVPGRGRILVFSFGSVTSGIPPQWAATQDRPGVNLLTNFSQEAISRVAAEIRQASRPGDSIVASIHWGANWGYEIPDAEIGFARRLIEEGVDLVHGHSSHHIKAFELYRGRPILYGCGDFLTDYEGIEGYERYRGDLAAMYFVTLAPIGTQPAQVRIVPMQVTRFRLNHATATDARWMWQMLNREGERFGTEISLNTDNSLTVQLSGAPSPATPPADSLPKNLQNGE